MKQRKSQIWKNIAIHSIFWMFWLVAPILFSVGDRGIRFPVHPEYYFRSFFTLALFYLNYFWLIDKTLFEHKIVRFLVVNVVFLAFITGFEFVQHEIFTSGLFRGETLELPEEGFKERRRPPVFIILTGMLFSYIFVISIAVAIKTTARWIKLDAQRKTLENENLKSELNNLKMQLNPHFFFNTLNNIYSLIQSDQDKAQEAVHRLAKLMRYHLYETNPEKVPLRGEIEFLESYVSLMKMRSTSMVEVSFNYQLSNDKALIAPLLFIPVIENAFKYGISNDIRSLIDIQISEIDNELSLSVKNNVVNKPDPKSEHTGIGLDNLRKRLNLIYPKVHTVSAGRIDDKFVVNLRINLS